MSKNMRKCSVLKAFTSLLHMHVRYFSTTWLKPSSAQKSPYPTVPEQLMVQIGNLPQKRLRCQTASYTLGTIPCKVHIFPTPREVHEELALCTERKPSALQPHWVLYHYPQGHEKNITFYTCDVLLSSIGSCFSSLSCTGALVSWNTVSFLSCTNSSQPPCWKAPPFSGKGSCR